VVAIAAIVYLLKYLFYPGAQEAPRVVVPGVMGDSQQQARQRLEDGGLLLGRVTERAEEGKLPGTVIEQDPPMGTRVPEGTRVDLIVAAQDSGPEETVEVIRVVGLPREDAEVSLKAVGLQVGEVEEVHDDEVPEGWVISQSIPPRTKVAKGQAVELTVSLGPASLEIEEPGDTPPDDDGAGGSQTAEGDADPWISVTEDPTFQSDDPLERRWDVSVLVTGTQENQLIEIVLRDQDQVRLTVHSDYHDPGYNIHEKVPTRGAATFEVYRDGTFIEKVEIPPPTGTATTGATAAPQPD